MAEKMRETNRQDRQTEREITIFYFYYNLYNVWHGDIDFSVAIESKTCPTEKSHFFVYSAIFGVTGVLLTLETIFLDGISAKIR